MATQLYTGLHPFRITGVNLPNKYVKAEWMRPKATKDGEYKQRNLIFNIYSPTPKIFGKLWLTVTNKPEVTKTGKSRYINALGQISKYVSSIKELEKPWTDGVSRPLYVGEYDYVNLTKLMQGYNDEANQKYLVAMEKASIDVLSIMEDTLTLTDFVNKLKEDKKIQPFGLLIYVNEVEKEGKQSFYQAVSNRFMVFLDDDGTIPQKGKDWVKTQIDQYKEYAGKELIQGHYTIDFKEFDESKYVKADDTPEMSMKVMEDIDEDSLPF